MLDCEWKSARVCTAYSPKLTVRIEQAWILMLTVV
jgi:hypothetical protein